MPSCIRLIPGLDDDVITRLPAHADPDTTDHVLPEVVDRADRSQGLAPLVRRGHGGQSPGEVTLLPFVRCTGSENEK